MNCDTSTFCREYDWADCRQRPSPNHQPAPHQNLALQKLANWNLPHREEPTGRILVLPTGGGKTFMAVHF